MLACCTPCQQWSRSNVRALGHVAVWTRCRVLRRSARRTVRLMARRGEHSKHRTPSARSRFDNSHLNAEELPSTRL
jgi:hypothetical protein